MTLGIGRSLSLELIPPTVREQGNKLCQMPESMVGLYLVSFESCTKFSLVIAAQYIISIANQTLGIYPHLLSWIVPGVYHNVLISLCKIWQCTWLLWELWGLLCVLDCSWGWSSINPSIHWTPTWWDWSLLSSNRLSTPTNQPVIVVYSLVSPRSMEIRSHNGNANDEISG
jgi:hypothetical protein